jgi:hypothetical protein
MATTPTGPPSSPPSIDLLSESLFKVVSMILIFVACLLVVGLGIQTYSYYGGLRAATAVATMPAGKVNPPPDLVDHAAVITYARGLGAAFIKTSALFLGFILIFTGTLYVLRTAEANFQLAITKGDVQGSLQTASPGLVIVTLGVLLTIVTLTVKSDLDYQKTTQMIDQPPVERLAPDTTPKPGAWSPAPPNPGNPITSAKETGH